MKGSGALALVVVLGACAPTSLAPSIIRYEPLNPDEPENRLGLRAGPRLAEGLTLAKSGQLDPDIGTPVPPQLGVALEFQRTQTLVGNLAAHFGAQCEVLYALPFPGIGLMAGLSYRHQIGTVSIAPAIAVRGATDFGVAVATVEGSYVGGDLSVTLSAKEGDTARLGVTPFLSINESFRSGVQDFVIFAGGMLFARFQSVELLVGFGRVFSGGTAWNVPLLGVRAGAN